MVGIAAGDSQRTRVVQVPLGVVPALEFITVAVPYDDQPPWRPPALHGDRRFVERHNLRIETVETRDRSLDIAQMLFRIRHVDPSEHVDTHGSSSLVREYCWASAQRKEQSSVAHRPT